MMWNDDGYEHDEDELDDCWHCSGDGWVECRDPIQCTLVHIENAYGQDHPCESCQGSGKRKDMTIW